MNKTARFRDLSMQSMLLATRDAELKMCEKCVELDSKIEHYQRLASRMDDQLMLDGIKELIEDMKAQKAALHPEETM